MKFHLLCYENKLLLDQRKILPFLCPLNMKSPQPASYSQTVVIPGEVEHFQWADWKTSQPTN